MVGMDFGSPGMTVDVAGEGRELAGTVKGAGEGVEGETNAALLALWAMLMQQQMQPQCESPAAGNCWEGTSEEAKDDLGLTGLSREGEEPPRRVAEMWRGLVAVPAPLERDADLNLLNGEGGVIPSLVVEPVIEEGKGLVPLEGGAAIVEALKERNPNDGTEEPIAVETEAPPMEMAPLSRPLVLGGDVSWKAGVEAEEARIGAVEPERKVRAEGAVAPVEMQQGVGKQDGGAESMARKDLEVGLRGMGEKVTAGGEELPVAFRTVLELEKNWRSNLANERERILKPDSGAETAVPEAGLLEVGREAKPVGGEMSQASGTELAVDREAEGQEKPEAMGAREGGSPVVEERRENRERDEPRPVAAHQAVEEVAAKEVRPEVLPSRAPALDGRAKAAPLAPAQRSGEIENFVLPGPPATQERKTIAIRIPLSETNQSGAIKHLDIVFEQRRNDLTLQIHSPSQELQREVESAMPSLVEKLRGENWTAKAVEPVTQTWRSDGAADAVRALEATPASGAMLESLREAVLGQSSGDSGFSFEDAPREQGGERKQPEERNPEHEETWRDEFVEQLEA